MKKKWFVSSGIFALLGGGFFFFKKRFKKNIPVDDKQRDKITAFFEKTGYKVHRYNENNDFILFNNKKNIKKHVLYDNGEMNVERLYDKLNAYYTHFTNEFYFIAKDDDTLFYKTKPQFNQWAVEYLGADISSTHHVTVHYTTFQRLTSIHDDNIWETVKL